VDKAKKKVCEKMKEEVCRERRKGNYAKGRQQVLTK